MGKRGVRRRILGNALIRERLVSTGLRQLICATMA